MLTFLSTQTVNAQNTITWDSNTIKGIYYDHNEHPSDPDASYSVFSKDGITLYASLWYYSRIWLKNCNWGTDTAMDEDAITFCSEVGNITSITITCTDANGALYEPEDHGWTVSSTSATWTGKSHSVSLSLKEGGEIKGIQHISFTVDGELKYAITVSRKDGNILYSGMPDGWSANKNLSQVGAGESVIFTTAIPTGKKIESLRAFNSTTGVSIYLTDNGDGTWTLPSMPKCNLYMLVEYVDAGISGAKYTISNIPNGWKVNGSTTGGTFQAEEGSSVVFTPANIPAGKKVKSVKVVSEP